MLGSIRHSRLLRMMPLLVWLMMLWNGFQNRHFHIGTQGEFISHAHPIQDGNEDHEHTEEELIFWDLISNPLFQFSNPSIDIPEVPEINCILLELVYDKPAFESLLLGSETLRGPPTTV
jgi:hypothetical protein